MRSHPAEICRPSALRRRNGASRPLGAGQTRPRDTYADDLVRNSKVKARIPQKHALGLIRGWMPVLRSNARKVIKTREQSRNRPRFVLGLKIQASGSKRIP